MLAVHPPTRDVVRVEGVLEEEEELQNESSQAGR